MSFRALAENSFSGPARIRVIVSLANPYTDIFIFPEFRKVIRATY